MEGVSQNVADNQNRDDCVLSHGSDVYHSAAGIEAGNPLCVDGDESVESVVPNPWITPPDPGETIVVTGELTSDDASYTRTDGTFKPADQVIRCDLYRIFSAGVRSISFEFRIGNDAPILMTNGLRIFGYADVSSDPVNPTNRCLNGQVLDAGMLPNVGLSMASGQIPSIWSLEV